MKIAIEAQRLFQEKKAWDGNSRPGNNKRTSENEYR